MENQQYGGPRPNPFEAHLGERYQITAQAGRPDEAQVEQVRQELAYAREMLGKCEMAARLVSSDGWKFLLEDIIIPQTSVSKILSAKGEKRAEAVGEVQALLTLRQRVEHLVKNFSAVAAKVAELEKKLETTENRR